MLVSFWELIQGIGPEMIKVVDMDRLVFLAVVRRPLANFQERVIVRKYRMNDKSRWMPLHLTSSFSDH